MSCLLDHHRISAPSALVVVVITTTRVQPNQLCCAITITVTHTTCAYTSKHKHEQNKIKTKTKHARQRTQHADTQNKHPSLPPQQNTVRIPRIHETRATSMNTPTHSHKSSKQHGGKQHALNSNAMHTHAHAHAHAHARTQDHDQDHNSITREQSSVRLY